MSLAPVLAENEREAHEFAAAEAKAVSGVAMFFSG